MKSESYFTNPIFFIGSTPITFSGVIKMLLILVVSYLLAKIFTRSIKKIGKNKLNPSVLYTTTRFVFYIIFGSGLLTAFSSMGIDLTAFAFVAGALSVGIGLGLQSLFQNFISGLILLLEKKLRVGDYIELESKECGVVERIHVRTTLIKTSDNTSIIVPNSELVSKKFINYSLSGALNFVKIPFRTAINEDPEKISSIVYEETKKIIPSSKEVEVSLALIGSDFLEFNLIVWIDRRTVSPQLQSTYLVAIQRTLRDNQIRFPELLIRRGNC